MKHTKHERQIWHAQCVNPYYDGQFDMHIDAMNFVASNRDRLITLKHVYVGLDHVCTPPPITVRIEMVKPTPEAVKDFPDNATADIVGIRNTKIGGHGAQNWTVRQALMAALNECDKWSRCVIVVADVGTDEMRHVHCKTYLRVENGYEALGMLAFATKHLSDDE